MTEEIQLLKDISNRLEAGGIEYMVTGSIALALYATPRMTRDIDIVVQIPIHRTKDIIALFEKDFYIDETSVAQAIIDKGMFNIIHSESIIKIDFIVCKDDTYRIEEFSRRQRLNIDGTAITVASAEDVILSKLVWARMSNSELQMRDAALLLATVPSLDRTYLDLWAGKIGVTELLSKAMTDA